MAASTKIEAAAEAADDAIQSAETSFSAVLDRLDKAVQEGLELFRAQSKTYASKASEQLDTAQHYVVERVQERPLTSAFAALGAGVLIGLLLAGRNK